MKIRVPNELLLVDALVVLLILAIIFFPANILRIVLGLPLVLVFPGYVSMAALFPRRNSLDGIQRAVFSFGVSIVVVILVGFFLGVGPTGIKLYPTLITLAIFVIAASLIAWYRRHRLVPAERSGLSLSLELPAWRGQAAQHKVLSITLIVAILGVAVTLGYAAFRPKFGNRFSEFYVLGLEGKVAGYPGALKVGKEERVVVRIANREGETVNYRVEVRIDGVRNSEVGPLALRHREEWEDIISFTPAGAGARQKVEFLLYKNAESEPILRPLNLWVDVKE